MQFIMNILNMMIKSKKYLDMALANGCIFEYED